MKNKSESFDINKIILKIQSPHIVIKEELKEYIIAQIEKLGKLFHRIDRCEAALTARKNDQKDIFEIEVKIFVPGNMLFAKEHKTNFRLAAQLVFDDLHNQLSKFKGQLKESGSEKQV